MKIGHPNNTKEYLGDSVYIETDGREFVMYLNNGLGPHDIIFLELNVIRSLLCFVKNTGIEL